MGVQVFLKLRKEGSLAAPRRGYYKDYVVNISRLCFCNVNLYVIHISPMFKLIFMLSIYRLWLPQFFSGCCLVKSDFHIYFIFGLILN